MININDLKDRGEKLIKYVREKAQEIKNDVLNNEKIKDALERARKLKSDILKNKEVKDVLDKGMKLAKEYKEKIVTAVLKNDQIKGPLDKVFKYARDNKQKLRIIGVVIVTIFVIMHVRGCVERNRKAKVQPRLVQTAIARKKTVPIYVDSFGTLSSPENVDIKAQVTGKIIEVNFVQGKEVAKGDLLFTIDPAPYQADLDKAEAALKKDMVQLKLKSDTLERNMSLIEKDLISQQEYETYQTEVAALAAQVELDKADIESAKINLNYCYIKSPIDGLTGKRRVDIGNIVPANTGPVLVNVKEIDELYLDFTLPERDLAEVRKAMEDNILDAQVSVPGDGKKTYSGKLEFIDNKVDDDTGTFALRATITNDDRALWPGQFVTIRLILGTEKDAVLVPYDAAQVGKQGYYVFVVKGHKADLRDVTAGSRQGDDIVIEKGVKAGERVVTVGQLGLNQGMPVFDTTSKVHQAELKSFADKKAKKITR
ncbi:MAG: efflux RND transporter periplasmic adaptor subunit [Candidatus Omnitrophica bacterium]|nr:efflux RND transporter periplasmic adaptor subunit [Candidatus Omnitrophota bacterium]